LPTRRNDESLRPKLAALQAHGLYLYPDRLLAAGARLFFDGPPCDEGR
jgi:hypothetical protein